MPKRKHLEGEFFVADVEAFPILCVSFYCTCWIVFWDLVEREGELVVGRGNGRQRPATAGNGRPSNIKEVSRTKRRGFPHIADRTIHFPSDSLGTFEGMEIPVFTLKRTLDDLGNHQVRANCRS